LHKTLGKIRTFVIPAGVLTRAKTNAHVFDTFWRARAHPRRSAHARSPAPCQPRVHARARVYKSHRGLDRTPPRITDPTRAQVRRSLPRERGASSRTSHDHRGPANLATPRPVRPSG
jgi:hypothetical protein